jgi:hypothetical protein
MLSEVTDVDCCVEVEIVLRLVTDGSLAGEALERSLVGRDHAVTPDRHPRQHHCQQGQPPHPSSHRTHQMTLHGDPQRLDRWPRSCPGLVRALVGPLFGALDAWSQPGTDDRPPASTAACLAAPRFRYHGRPAHSTAGSTDHGRYDTITDARFVVASSGSKLQRTGWDGHAVPGGGVSVKLRLLLVRGFPVASWRFDDRSGALGTRPTG